MLELLHEAISPANIILTTLLGIVVIYWLFVIIGALDLDFLDFDIDVDADVDADMDMDVDADADAGSGSNWFVSTLQFFNIGAIPVMILFSVLIRAMWILGILANYYVLNNHSLGTGMAIMPFTLLISLFITKFVTTPLVYLFKNLDTSHIDANLLGSVATIVLAANTHKMGQAELYSNNDHLVVNVLAKHKQTLNKGTKVIIVEHNKAKNYYLVEKAGDGLIG